MVDNVLLEQIMLMFVNAHRVILEQIVQQVQLVVEIHVKMVEHAQINHQFQLVTIVPAQQIFMVLIVKQNLLKAHVSLQIQALLCVQFGLH
jgi:hypothetical protein